MNNEKLDCKQMQRETLKEILRVHVEMMRIASNMGLTDELRTMAEQKRWLVRAQDRVQKK